MDEYKQIDPTWLKKLKQEMNNSYFLSMMRFIEKRRGEVKVFPAKENVFAALSVPLDKVNVMILGQDPYHTEKKAIGAAFAIAEGEKLPPSLRNIYKEIKSDTGKEAKDLKEMQKQGVMLLNTILTVEEGAPLSHQNIGWESFTDAILRLLWERDKKIVFLLWGNKAKRKARKVFVGKKGHLVLEAGHPSPLSSRYFFGSKHFSKARGFLREEGEDIDWCKAEKENT